MFFIAFYYKTCLVVLVFSVFVRLGIKDIGTDFRTDFKSKLGEFKVHLTPKIFFRLNKSLHLFETLCAFLN